nr:MAG: nonstructural protein [Microvirus sp.]
MIKNVYTVHDAKAEAYLDPFFARSHGEAIRSFESAIATPDHPFNRHAKDYSLVHIGTFDDATATLEPHLLPNVLASGLEVSSRQVIAA